MDSTIRDFPQLVELAGDLRRIQPSHEAIAFQQSSSAEGRAVGAEAARLELSPAAQSQALITALTEAPPENLAQLLSTLADRGLLSTVTNLRSHSRHLETLIAGLDVPDAPKETSLPSATRSPRALVEAAIQTLRESGVPGRLNASLQKLGELLTPPANPDPLQNSEAPPPKGSQPTPRPGVNVPGIIAEAIAPTQGERPGPAPTGTPATRSAPSPLGGAPTANPTELAQRLASALKGLDVAVATPLGGVFTQGFAASARGLAELLLNEGTIRVPGSLEALPATQPQSAPPPIPGAEAARVLEGRLEVLFRLVNQLSEQLTPNGENQLERLKGFLTSLSRASEPGQASIPSPAGGAGGPSGRIGSAGQDPPPSPGESAEDLRNARQFARVFNEALTQETRSPQARPAVDTQNLSGVLNDLVEGLRGIERRSQALSQVVRPTAEPPAPQSAPAGPSPLEDLNELMETLRRTLERGEAIGRPAKPGPSGPAGRTTSERPDEKGLLKDTLGMLRQAEQRSRTLLQGLQEGIQQLKAQPTPIGREQLTALSELLNGLRAAEQRALSVAAGQHPMESLNELLEGLRRTERHGQTLLRTLTEGVQRSTHQQAEHAQTPPAGLAELAEGLGRAEKHGQALAQTLRKALDRLGSRPAPQPGLEGPNSPHDPLKGFLDDLQRTQQRSQTLIQGLKDRLPQSPVLDDLAEALGAARNRVRSLSRSLPDRIQPPGEGQTQAAGLDELMAALRRAQQHGETLGRTLPRAGAQPAAEGPGEQILNNPPRTAPPAEGTNPAQPRILGENGQSLTGQQTPDREGLTQTLNDLLEGLRRSEQRGRTLLEGIQRSGLQPTSQNDGDLKAALDLMAKLHDVQARGLVLSETLLKSGADSSDPLARVGENQQKILDNFLTGLRDAQRQAETLGQTLTQLADAARARRPALTPQLQQRAIEGGFTFELEVRRSEQMEVVVSRLRENGFETVRVSTEQEQVVRLRVTVGGVQRSDPIVLDLNRDGEISLKGPRGEGAQRFDINADGRLDRTAFVAGGDAFLALDRNGNGRIDTGRELFGDQNGARNGIEELARFDDNRDGQINRNDTIFNQLVAFYDINRDGIVGESEFKPIEELGVERLMLEYKPVEIIRPDQNLVSGLGSMEFEDGEVHQMVDVDLVYE